MGLPHDRMALNFPSIYILPTRIDADKLSELKSQIPSYTNDINEAQIILAKLTQKRRAEWELRRLNLFTEEIPPEDPASPASKRRRLQDHPQSLPASAPITPSRNTLDHETIVKVIRLDWFTDSIANKSLLPIDEYVLYEGKRVHQSSRPKNGESTPRMTPGVRLDSQNLSSRSKGHPSHSHKPGFPRANAPQLAKRPAFSKETTSDHEQVDDLPSVPQYLYTIYSCQRPTPANPPNNVFIGLLKDIRTLRALSDDGIGVRAYSTSIATLSAYPHELSIPSEVERLPGCSKKIAGLYQEWRETGKIQETERAKSDPKLSVLTEFHKVWGVGETTARDFYGRGWRDLDDIVEYGWTNLLRVQQIGVKYFDEFLQRIPRNEVEHIADTILKFACQLRPGFEMVICGGYRRGNFDSGDVDILLSHRDPEATANFIKKLVRSLEDAGYITHTLRESTHNSQRGQEPLPWKGPGQSSKAGFDTLDKALVVWQEPPSSPSRLETTRGNDAGSTSTSSPTLPSDAQRVKAAGDDQQKNADEKQSQQGHKNTNIHRRVDIVITPWRTAGCAVVGWTGATTFERDLRRYCKTELGLKFDSSGVRKRSDGVWLDLESGVRGEPAPNMLEAEKRVFEGLNLDWVPPDKRCTG